MIITCIAVCRYGLFAALSGLVKQDLKPYMEKIVHYLLISLKSTEGVTVSEAERVQIYFMMLILYTLFSLFWKFKPPYLGKATTAARAALHSPTIACWVLSCFRNPPKSDIHYRIFNAYVIILMRAYTQGGWAHRQISTTFLTRENSQIVLVLLAGFEPWVLTLDLESEVLPIGPHSHPRSNLPFTCCSFSCCVLPIVTSTCLFLSLTPSSHSE